MGGLTCKGSGPVDYVVASAHMFKFIHGFDIIDFCNLYSDVHNPFSISISPVALNVDSSESIVETQSCVKLWSLDRANDFQNNIDSCKVEAIENELDILNGNVNTEHIRKYTVKGLLKNLV